MKIIDNSEPDQEALELYYREKEASDYPIGSVLEVLQPGNLTKRISDNGWPPHQIELRLSGGLEFPKRTEVAVQSMIGTLVNDGKLKEPNWPKYFVQCLPDPFKDSISRPVLQLATTDYFHTAAASRLLMTDRTLRREIVSTRPERNLVPNSLCLHALVEFQDQRVLLLKRSEKSWYYPGAYSISFEEQLSHHDFCDGPENAVAKLIHRAICEEVFPLANWYEESPELAWNAVNDHVKNSRIWSVFLEQEIGNFSLFCHIGLKLKSHDYCEAFRAIKRRGGKRDNEGRLFALDFDLIKELLDGGRPLAQELLVEEIGNPEIFGEASPVGSLHPTSRYRLLTWATVKGLI